jgi:hypothetical protein
MNEVSGKATPEDTPSLQEVRQLADIIASSLPDRIQIAALSLKSKLPFKAISLRELLLHRVSALATPAVELFERDQIIPAVVLTRSIVETFALFYALHERLVRFLAAKNSADLDDFLMRSLVGARNRPEMPSSINVLTLIDRVEKIIPGFRSVYDSLCEYTHPNWAGTLGAFGEIDQEAFELKLGLNERTPAWKTGVAALSGALMAFRHYYNDSANLVQQLNSYFE